jgi:hypothetical protein
MKKFSDYLAWLFCTALMGLGAIYAVQLLHSVSTSGVKYNRVEVQSER